MTMNRLFSKLILSAVALLAVGVASAQTTEVERKHGRETIKLGAPIEHDSLKRRHTRGMEEHLIIPKGEWQLGVQVSHASISSDNSEYMLLLKNIDASGSITKVAPYVAYSYHDNRSIGLKMQYTSASGNIEQGELDFLSDDLNFDIENVRAEMNSIQVAVYHRSYIGLDSHGQLGLFSDISLGYTNSKTVFTYNAETADTHSRSNQLKLSLHPGIVIFALNNVSTHVSMGIGGVTFNNTKYIKGGEVIGTRNFSKANFKLDVLDISIGVTVHL
jgi:hypothetical protein